MRIAIPLRDGAFCPHFGRCEEMWLCDGVTAGGEPTSPRILQQPPRRPDSGCESLPRWLHSIAVTHVLVGGMGQAAQQQLRQLGIEVSVGHNAAMPLDVLQQFIASPSGQRENICTCSDHEHHHCRE